MRELLRHPDWMYELYSSTLQPRNIAMEGWFEKPVQERERTPLMFSWKNEPYLYWLEQRGLI